MSTSQARKENYTMNVDRPYLVGENRFVILRRIFLAPKDPCILFAAAELREEYIDPSLRSG